MSKTSKLIRTIVEVALFAAIGFALDTLQGGFSKSLFPNGGSIGFAMIAVIIIGFRRGFFPALATGLIIGIFDFLTGPYILSPIQAILDYVTPYAFVSVSALFRPIFLKQEERKNKIIIIILATFVGGMGKFLSHFFAGFYFLSDNSSFAWGLENINPYLYCFIYNIAFIGPSIILTILLLIGIEIRTPFILEATKPNKEVIDKHTNYVSYVSSIIIFTSGLALFISYLVLYIKSIDIYYDGDASGFEANGDYIAIILFSLLTFGLGIYGLISSIKKAKKEYNIFGGFSLICTCSTLYAIGITIKGAFKALAKGKEYPFSSYQMYIIWISVSFFLAALSFILMIYYRKKKLASNN